ncbi:hypothetical protein MUO32_26275 [Shinella sp. CPCC 101442]|uniref:hypothetical protein n=1 Tax=Shinella sp. CPCC 101442 TaxID=2932265 RepID=UPI00215248A2|nr:hypothetical protein [Shinella sp. CPCC 101442]MCR6502538.1 hypothetical protein [Shinella sp. CPCC 101442]
MADRPILFSAPMVLALLDGRKTQTRRIVKPQPDQLLEGQLPKQLRITVDDRLWVKENHAIVPRTAYRMSEGVQQTLRPDDDHDAAVYAADWERSKPGRWRPSIHMPRWASRLTLTVTDVRVERLQSISEVDAVAEGCFKGKASGRVFNNSAAMHLGGDEWATARDWYADLWESINGDGTWDANPWVAAYTFTVERRNIYAPALSAKDADHG